MVNCVCQSQNPEFRINPENFHPCMPHYTRSTPEMITNSKYTSVLHKNCRHRAYISSHETTTTNCLYHSLCYHGNHNNVVMATTNTAVMTTIRSDNKQNGGQHKLPYVLESKQIWTQMHSKWFTLQGPKLSGSNQPECTRV